MYYYALVDANNICTSVYALPAPITGNSYIEITADLYNDTTLIGKKYVNGTWVELTTYYYAILDDKNIVINVYESQTEMPAADNMVRITFDQFNDSELIGKWYNRELSVFTEPPVSVLAAHSTEEIQYKNEEKTLSDKLDEMEQAIANGNGGGVVVNAYTKVESDAKYAPIGASYTKDESDERYALAGSTGGAPITGPISAICTSAYGNCSKILSLHSFARSMQSPCPISTVSPFSGFQPASILFKVDFNAALCPRGFSTTFSFPSSST